MPFHERFSQAICSFRHLSTVPIVSSIEHGIVMNLVSNISPEVYHHQQAHSRLFCKQNHEYKKCLVYLSCMYTLIGGDNS